MFPIGMKRTARKFSIDWEGQQTVSNSRIPELECPIRGRGGDCAPIRAECATPDPIGMTRKSEQFCSTGNIPELECPIRGRGGDCVPIRAECATPDPIGMTRKSEPFCSTGNIPELECTFSRSVNNG